MSESIDFLEIGIGLFGGLALFLYGMHEMSEALKAMCAAAEAGRDSTVAMVAKVGRSARLGERSPAPRERTVSRRPSVSM